jgi:hypothetical protein
MLHQPWRHSLHVLVEPLHVATVRRDVSISCMLSGGPPSRQSSTHRHDLLHIQAIIASLTDQVSPTPHLCTLHLHLAYPATLHIQCEQPVNRRAHLNSCNHELTQSRKSMSCAWASTTKRQHVMPAYARHSLDWLWLHGL